MLHKDPVTGLMAKPSTPLQPAERMNHVAHTKRVILNKRPIKRTASAANRRLGFWKPGQDHPSIICVSTQASISSLGHLKRDATGLRERNTSNSTVTNVLNGYRAAPV